MKILKVLLGIIVILFLVGLVMVLMAPKDYEVVRSKEINAPAAAVYNNVANFAKWPAWSAWKEMDPDASYTIDGEDGQVGTKQFWKGEISGEGSMEILEAVPNSSVKHKLTFTAPQEGISETLFSIDVVDSTKSKLTWKMSGKNEGVMAKLFSTFFDMDEMIGKDFDRGLFKLDSILVAQQAIVTPAE